MPRLFAALDVTRDAGLALSLLKGGLHQARWIDPENYHITLRFIGDVSGREADDICDLLATLDHGPVEIAFDGLGVFGSSKAHSLYARVRPNPALIALQSAIDRQILRLGHAPDKRRFTPHVTLARLKNGQDEAALARYLTDRSGVLIPPFVADRFSVLSSRDSVGGGPYALEAEYMLTPETEAYDLASY